MKRQIREPCYCNPLQNEEKLIFQALDDGRYDFRTVEGIAQDTGLPEETIKEVIEKNPKHIRKCLLPDEKGRELYTLAARRMKAREYIALARAFLAKSPR
jgi:hypothetical protein